MNRAARWIPLLLAAALFFGWKSYRAWTGPVLPGEPARARESFLPDEPGPPAPAAGGGAIASAVSRITARPLFRPDRSPYTEAGAVLPGRNYEAELSRYTLLGVLFLDGERKGIVSDRSSGGAGSREVGAGDTLEGFAVKSVEEDGMVLEADGREFTLPLYGGSPKGGAATPVRAGTSGRPGASGTPPARLVPGGRPAVPPGFPASTPTRPPEPRRIYRPGRR
ncbi:MAG: hypothetical protein Kow00128_22280 [Deltaproteobacteria bacterium]